jgi:hypothetical protein
MEFSSRNPDFRDGMKAFAERRPEFTVCRTPTVMKSFAYE